MLKFICQAYDTGSNPIKGGCGEVESAIIDLKFPLDKVGEGRSASLSKDGKIFFTNEQGEKLPKGRKPSEIAELIHRWCGEAKFLYFAGCPNEGCKNLVKINHHEVKSELSVS
jgi:hypothetical protein